MKWNLKNTGLGRYWLSMGSGVRMALGFCLLAFAIQNVVARADLQTLRISPNGESLLMVLDPLTTLFAIHGPGLRMGFFWSPVTYMFLHGSLMHLLLNALGLLVMGRMVEQLLGTSHFWRIFLVSGVFGGLGWALSQGLASPVPCVGASGGVLGLVGAYAVLRPHDRFMLILPFPITLSARTLAIWLALANMIELAFGHGNVAYLAHVVGLLAGSLYAWRLRQRLNHAPWSRRS